MAEQPSNPPPPPEEIPAPPRRWIGGTPIENIEGVVRDVSVSDMAPQILPTIEALPQVEPDYQLALRLAVEGTPRIPLDREWAGGDQVDCYLTVADRFLEWLQANNGGDDA